MTANEKYNGWKNRQTWLAKLWIDNTYDLYTKSIEITKAFEKVEPLRLAKALESMFDGCHAKGLVDDLPLSERHLIDWQEIAEECLNDIKEDGWEREKDGESNEEYEARMAEIRLFYESGSEDFGNA